jgi:hypothetical protein
MCPYYGISNISGGILGKMTEFRYSRLRLFNSDCERIRQHQHEDSEKWQHTKNSRFCLLPCHFVYCRAIPDSKLLIQILKNRKKNNKKLILTAGQKAGLTNIS